MNGTVGGTSMEAEYKYTRALYLPNKEQTNIEIMYEVVDNGS